MDTIIHQLCSSILTHLPPLQGRHWFGEDGLVQISGTILQSELLRPDAVEYANVHQCREELQVYRSVSDLLISYVCMYNCTRSCPLSANVLPDGVQYEELCTVSSCVCSPIL